MAKGQLRLFLPNVFLHNTVKIHASNCCKKNSTKNENENDACCNAAGLLALLHSWPGGVGMASTFGNNVGKFSGFFFGSGSVVPTGLVSAHSIVFSA